jgi:hypothetical protein
MSVVGCSMLIIVAAMVLLFILLLVLLPHSCDARSCLAANAIIGDVTFNVHDHYYHNYPRRLDNRQASLGLKRSYNGSIFSCFLARVMVLGSARL